MSWVDGLGTRSGGLRSESIKWCGRLYLTYDPRDGSVGYRPKYCRDRACPACAKRRSRTASAQLRNMLANRKANTKTPCGSLYFATLTHPKLAADVESPGAAVSRLLDEWRKLRNRRGFNRCVAGFVRAVEVTWSRSSGAAGWHAHLHIVFELRANTDQWAAWHYLRDQWCDITGGSEAAQDWQWLSAVSVHQIAKYITKPFELPADQAVLFFKEMAGRRIIEGSGTWRRWRLDDTAAPTTHIEQRHTLTDLCVMASRREDVHLHWRRLANGTLESVGGVRELRDGESYESRTVPAIVLVESMRASAAKEKDSETSGTSAPARARGRPPPRRSCPTRHSPSPEPG